MSGVRTLATFRSGKFNLSAPEPHWINPGCFGEDLASWLHDRLLRVPGLQVAPPDEEDWGWFLPITREGDSFRLDIGLVPEEPPEWMVHLVPQPSLLQRLKGGISDAAILALLGNIHQTLQTIPDISALSWHLAGLHARGDASSAASTPAG